MCEGGSTSKFPLIITSLPSSVVRKCIVIEGGAGESKAKGHAKSALKKIVSPQIFSYIFKHKQFLKAISNTYL